MGGVPDSGAAEGEEDDYDDTLLLDAGHLCDKSDRGPLPDWTRLATQRRVRSQHLQVAHAFSTRVYSLNNNLRTQLP